MPSYTYTCKCCGKTFSSIETISKRNEPTECECGGLAERDIEAELAPGKVTKLITDNERWSWSMAVPANQREEYKKKFPNHVLDDKGRVLIKNRKDKLQKMKDRGFVEYGSNETPWK